MPITLTYEPENVGTRLLDVLGERNRRVLSSRLGLEGKRQPETLESIGRKYGITRERVRQIENFALDSIRKSDAYRDQRPAFDELREAMERSGGLVHEASFLEGLSQGRKTEAARNHLLLLLMLGEEFSKYKEDDHFHHRWSMDHELAEKVHQCLHDLHENLTDEHLISEDEIVDMLLERMKTMPEQHRHKEAASQWLALSKRVGKNPVGDWGLAYSPNVRLRGIRDYAYLVLRKAGKPMHFSMIAKEITEEFGKKAHTATCHNELIKDQRFVLVGRGLYGLSEWGYSDGVVREVIRDVLRENGPLDKESIIEHVLKERFVKANTVLVNLQNDKNFTKTPEGKFDLA